MSRLAQTSALSGAAKMGRSPITRIPFSRAAACRRSHCQKKKNWMIFSSWTSSASRPFQFARAAGLLSAISRSQLSFHAPETVDITRQENKHLSFSNGIHYCLGAPLALLEGAIALTALTQRFPDMRLASERLEWGDNVILRGLKSLPVVVG